MRRLSLNLVNLKHGLSMLLCIMPLLASAQPNDPTVIKAALSYNFAKFTHWQDTQKIKRVTLCYFNPVYQAGFEKLNGKTIKDKKIVVKQINNVNLASQCQLIYIDSHHRNKMQRLLLYLDGKPVLTVSDMTGFIDDGGMVEIVRDDNKLRFKINLVQLQQQGLNMSSQVLKLAIQVKKDN